MKKWKSVKLDGYPLKEGEYLVTVEGVLDDSIEGIDLKPGERGVALAEYYGFKAWGLREGIYRVVAWTELIEVYSGE